MARLMKVKLFTLLVIIVAGLNAPGYAQPVLTQITGEGVCTAVEQSASSAPPSATTDPPESLAAAESAQSTAEPSPQAAEPPLSKQATIKLLQTSMGRVLEVENEYIAARGTAAQVQDKKTGEVGYFLDYGSAGTISVIFNVDQGGQVEARLTIVDNRYPGHRYEYTCEKKPS